MARTATQPCRDWTARRRMLRSAPLLAALAGLVVACAAAPPATDVARTPAEQSQLSVPYLLEGERVTPVARHVPRTPGVGSAAIRALLRGPTAAERRRGYGGWFSRQTAGRLIGVRLSGGVAHVDFRDFSRIIPNASTSCGSAQLLAQLDRTVLQFDTVDRAVYSFDGDVDRFCEWLQRTPPGG